MKKVFNILITVILALASFFFLAQQQIIFFSAFGFFAIVALARVIFE